MQSVEFVHWFEHELFEQTWFDAHVVPHVPQLALSVFVLAQYGGLPLQKVCVPKHVFEHALLTQTRFVPQTLPHEPQLAVSVFVVAQYGGLPLQNVCVPKHVFEHEPLTQTRFVPQTLPHDPQLALSVFVSAQYGGFPLQNVWLPPHVFEHVPLTQTRLVPQTLPHEPQLALSVFVLAQYGEPVSPPQKVWLPPQLFVHAPLTHTSWVPHVFPHVPQLALSVFVFAQYGCAARRACRASGRRRTPSVHDAVHARSAARRTLYRSRCSSARRSVVFAQYGTPRVGRAERRSAAARRPALAGRADLARRARLVPHVPQLLLSVSVVAQNAPPSVTHSVCPRPHDETHLPVTHSEPTPQYVPHVPQLFGSTLELDARVAALRGAAAARRAAFRLASRAGRPRTPCRTRRS